MKLKCDEALSSFAYKFNFRRYIKDLNNRAASRARDECKGARPQMAGDAWLRVAECSSELPSSQTLASDRFTAPAPQAQLATSIRIEQESNSHRRAGTSVQPEHSKRFFTAPMVRGHLWNNTSLECLALDAMRNPNPKPSTLNPKPSSSAFPTPRAGQGQTTTTLTRSACGPRGWAWGSRPTGAGAGAGRWEEEEEGEEEEEEGEEGEAEGEEEEEEMEGVEGEEEGEEGEEGEGEEQGHRRHQCQSRTLCRYHTTRRPTPCAPAPAWRIRSRSPPAAS